MTMGNQAGMPPSSKEGNRLASFLKGFFSEKTKVEGLTNNMTPSSPENKNKKKSNFIEESEFLKIKDILKQIDE